MKISGNILELIGNTPIVELNNIAKPLKCDIYENLEYQNPGGSLKDRVALYIIEDAERKGALKPGGLIVEATSGNMGVAFALVGAMKNYI